MEPRPQIVTANGLNALSARTPTAMSILISGGGMPMGQVIGSTDAVGARPASRELDPHDFLATIYRFLGINHELQLPDPAGRPISLTNGKPIAELF